MERALVNEPIHALAHGELAERLVLGNTLFAAHVLHKRLALAKVLDVLLPAHATFPSGVKRTPSLRIACTKLLGAMSISPVHAMSGNRVRICR